MYETILVAVDGSPEADSSVGFAIALAQIGGGTVHALSVTEPTIEPTGLDPEQAEELRRFSTHQSKHETKRATDRAVAAGVEALAHVDEGIPYRAITGYADEVDADLVVVGTRGETPSEDDGVGSTASRVITLADVPVLAVPHVEASADDHDDVSIDRVVIPTDGSDAADRAAAVALDLAASVGATVHVVYVLDRTVYDLEDAPRSIIGILREGGQNALASVEADARERGLSVRTDLRRGIPSAELRRYAADVDADLIAMGTRGAGSARADDRLLGSTTERVLTRTDRPVFTVNPAVIR